MKKKDIKTIFSIIISIISSFGIIAILPETNSILLVILTILYYLLLTKQQYKDKKMLGYSILFSTILSAIYIMGNQVDDGNVIIYNFEILKKIIGLTISISSIAYMLMNNQSKLFQFRKKENNKKISTIKLFIPIFTVSIIYYLLLFPGVYGYDAGYQIAQFMENNIPITTHFSIVNSYFMYTLVNIGYKIVGNYEFGFSIYTLIQMIFINYVIAKSIKFAYDETNSKKLLWLLIGFFMISPMHHILSLSSCQDVYYAGLLVMFGMHIYKYIKYGELHVIKTIITSILLCLSRNNGIYVIVFVLIVLILFKSKQRKKIIAVLLIIFFGYTSINSLLINVFSAIKSDSIREMLSLPSQQIVNVYTYRKEELSEEEKKQIELFYPGEQKKYYDERQLIADISKGTLDTEYTKDNIFQYIKMYIQLGIKYPTNYTSAFLFNTSGIWYPDKKYYDSRMYHPYIEINMLDAKLWNEEYIEIERKPLIKSNRKLHEYINDNKWKETPFISILLTGGTYFVLTIYTIIYNLYRKNYDNILSITPIIAQYIILILSPVILFRYIYSVILLTPLVLVNNFTEKRKKNETT